MSSGQQRTFGIMAVALAFGGIAGAALGAYAGTTMGSILVGAAYMGGSFVGQMIFPAPNNRDMPTAPDYPMQTVDKGSPVKLTYGTLRVAGNLVWMGPITHYHASGGKGSDDGPKQYRRSFLISICEGPRNVLRLWKGKTEITISTGNDNKTGLVGAIFTAIAQEVTVFHGDGYNEGLETLIGEDYSSYKNDCCVLFKNYDLGPVAVIPAFVFEVGPYAIPDYYLHTGRGLAIIDADDGETIATVTGSAMAGPIAVTQVDVAKDGSALFMMKGPNGFSTIYYRSSDSGEGTPAKDLMPYPDVVSSHAPPALVGGWVEPDYQYLCWSNRAKGCAFNSTGEYAYISVDIVWAHELSVTRFYVYKINVRTGEVEWRYPKTDTWLTQKGGTSRIRVDSGDNAYVIVNGYLGGINEVLRIKPNGHLDQAYNMFVGTSFIRDIWVDEDFVIYDHETGEEFVGFLFASGSITLTGQDYHYARWQKLVDPNDYFGAIIADGHPSSYGWDTGFNCVRTYNNLIYLSGTRQYAAPNHIIQVYNAWGVLIDGFDCGPESDPPDPDYQPSGYGHTMDTDGRIVLTVTNYDEFVGTAYILSAGTLTELTSQEVPCYDDANIVGMTICHAPFADPYDANPADIILDIVMHRRYGAGMPGEYINGPSFSDIHTYCQKEDLLISVEINSSRSVIDWVQFICSHFGGFPYWVGGELYLGAWRNEDPQFHITRDHLVVDEEGGIPVQIKKRDYSKSSNQIELGWQDRDANYGPSVSPFRDDVDIRLSGKRRKSQIFLPGIKRETLAAKMGWRYLIDSMYRFSLYTFTLGAKDMLLTPGMVGLISDGFHLTDQRIRITTISEAKDGFGLEIEAVDDISDLYPDLSSRQFQTTLREPEVYPTEDDLEDGTVTIKESDETNELSLSIAPGGEYTDGWRIYLSWDGETYEIYKLVTVDALTGGEANSIGVSMSTLPAEKAIIWRPDQSILVDIGTLTDLKTDVTAATFFQNGSLIKLGDEIIGFKTAVETATEGQWLISELTRGLFDTTPAAHAIGERFATLDSDIAIPFETSDVGRTVYVKILTAYGNLSQYPADVEATEYIIQGLTVRPLGANLVRLTADVASGWDDTYSGDAITLYWGLPGRDSGFNLGGYDGGGTWAWGDDELELVPQNGVLWGAYAQDPELEAVDLEFRHESGTLLGAETLGVVSTATISKATDLDGNNPATVHVYPVRSRRAIRPEPISIDDGS